MKHQLKRFKQMLAPTHPSQEKSPIRRFFYLVPLREKTTNGPFYTIEGIQEKQLVEHFYFQPNNPNPWYELASTIEGSYEVQVGEQGEIWRMTKLPEQSFQKVKKI